MITDMGQGLAPKPGTGTGLSGSVPGCPVLGRCRSSRIPVYIVGRFQTSSVFRDHDCLHDFGKRDLRYSLLEAYSF